MSDEREPLWSDDRIEAELRRIGDNMRLYIADAATVAEQVRDEYEARIAELEQESAQRWEPVNEKFILTYDTGLVDTPKQFVRWNADDESVIVGKDDGSFYHCPLPDNIRLCRLVERAEVQPYSHRNGETEPPTVEGWYAMQHPQAWNWQGSTFVFVERNMDGIDVYCAGQDDPIWYDQMDSRIRWYGPIVPPWEVDHE